MPEIAEVETVKNTLKMRILNKRIKRVDVYYEPIIESNLDSFKKDLVGESFIDIKRRGKWLIFETEHYYLLSHLRMEGKYFIKDKNDIKDKHEHVIFTFQDDSTLRYADTRKFGRMNLILKQDLENIECIKKQGLEPGDQDLTSDYLLQKFKNKSIPIKTALLDQTIISGLGNIYANEICFAMGLDPNTPASNLTKKSVQELIDVSCKILNEAIEQGGTTIHSFSANGIDGLFQVKLKAHMQKICPICNGPISKIKIKGRGTYYCPHCQKRRR